MIDTHCHLDDREFEDDLDAVIKRSGLDAMITVGTSVESSRRAALIAEKYPNVYFAVGVHPHEADRVQDALELEPTGRHPKCVAVGETGLDYFKGYSKRENQRPLLESHLELAWRLKKPLSIHCREAHGDLYELLRRAMPRPIRGVLHCYSGSPEMVAKFVDLGVHISFAGPVTYPNAVRLREAVKATPLDRMLVETDAPVLTPQPMRGRRNEPAYLRFTVQRLAEILGKPFELVRERTSENARILFGLT